MAWSAQEVARIINGTLTASRSTTFTSISTDPRACHPGVLFVALTPTRETEGELAEALARGATGVVVPRRFFGGIEGVRGRDDISRIEVDAPLTALEELAWTHRRAHNIPVIALAGSNGKTSTNDMLSSILSTRYRVLRTADSQDDRVGLASTLLNLDSSHDAAVLELGAGAPGDLRRMTEIAVPDVAVLLNIGPTHRENLGSMDAIAAAQGELFQGHSPFQTVKVANGEDPEVRALAEAAHGQIRWFSAAYDADVCLRARTDGVDVQVVRLDFDGQMVVVRMAYLGRPQALNAAAAVAAATALPERLQASREDIIEGLKAARPRTGRFTIHRDHDRILIDDAYDANPASVEAALASASRWAALEERRLVVVLGQISALHAASSADHATVGRRVADRGVRVFATLGPHAAAASKAAADRGVTARHENDDVEKLAHWVREQLGPRDLVLFTGSRGMRTERVLEHLRKA